MHPSKLKCLALFFLTVVLAAGLAQAGSYIVSTHLAIGATRVINPILWLTHVRNFGGVFSIFSGKGWLFAVYAFCLLSGLAVFLIRSKTLPAHDYFFFGLIVGGGVSNILDRMIYGAVVDFINLQRVPYWHYIFNTADVMIHLGLWPVLLSFMTARKPAAPSHAGLE